MAQLTYDSEHRLPARRTITYLVHTQQSVVVGASE